MKPNEIRAGLMLAEVRIISLSKQLELSTAAIHQVINGQRKNPRIRRAIAEVIGKPVVEIWPELVERKVKKDTRPLDAVRAQ
jgi:lambda repressor-like predicted transcriptional regulator